MRQGTNNRRSRGRGGRKQPPGRFQTFDSNGPNGRLRGNAHQLYEKYVTLGRDATGSGDRITAENFFQHAEHYFRIMNANGGDGAARSRVNGDGEQPGVAAVTQEAVGEAPPEEAEVAGAAGAETKETRSRPKGNGKAREESDDEETEATDGDQPIAS